MKDQALMVNPSKGRLLEVYKTIILGLKWTIVLSLNLIIPLLFGLSLVERMFRAGIGLAILCWWAVGLALARLRPALLRSLLWGGLFVAFSQLIPALQFGAGALAIMLATLIDNTTLPVKSNVVSFGVTLVTGGELIAVAAIIDKYFGFLSGPAPSDDRTYSERREKSLAKPPSEQELL